MSSHDAAKWDAVYQDGGHDRVQPARVLLDFAHLLPAQGTALDLACGTGANALFLAKQGLVTSAWDISGQAIARLEQRAQQLQLNISTRICDALTNPPAPESFDIIIVSYFLDRTLLPLLIRALKKNGLLYYQTYIRENVTGAGPVNPDYRLGPDELLQLCHGLHIIYYHEEGCAGDTNSGFRDEAMLIGQRRLLI